MNRIYQAALLAAGFAVAGGAAAGADAVRAGPMRSVSLTSFGAAQSLSAWQLSNTGLVAMGGPAVISRDAFGGAILALPTATLGSARDSFAASLALSPRFALDSGYNLDLAQRFGNTSGLLSPLIATGDFTSLANGGSYAGATWMPSSVLHLRVGAVLKKDALDSFSFGPSPGALDLPLVYDAAQSRSLLAGFSWDMSNWASLGVTAIHNDQSGLPLGLPVSSLGSAGRVSTNALDMTANVKFGNGWVASYRQGVSQLDQRAASTAVPQVNQSYAISIAKHGLFGDDALGLSFSRPSGLLENGFDLVAATGNLPPAFISNASNPDRAAETDLQVGYVTSFDGGAVALQTNAAYQMNYQGQTGATSLSVLSRAKIKF